MSESHKLIQYFFWSRGSPVMLRSGACGRKHLGGCQASHRWAGCGGTAAGRHSAALTTPSRINKGERPGTAEQADKPSR